MPQKDAPHRKDIPSRDGLAGILGPLELEIMNTLWRLGTGTVGDVVDHSGTQDSYTTVKTVMERLVKKHLLKRRREGKAYVYEPVESRDALEVRISRQMIDNLLRGFGSKAISQFADVLREDPRRLQELRNLLEGMAQDDGSGLPCGPKPGEGTPSEDTPGEGTPREGSHGETASRGDKRGDKNDSVPV